MKIISVFNNKGGVGKSTLSFHLGKALGLMGKSFVCGFRSAVQFNHKCDERK